MSGLSSKKPAVVGRVWHYLTFFQRVRQRLLSLEKAGVELRQKISHVEQDHAAAVAWARKTYPEIVAAIESRVAESQLNCAIQDIYSVVHRENGKLSERLGRVEQGGGGAAPVVAPTVSQLNDTSRIDSFYLELERCFRGPEEEILRRVRYYLPMVSGFETRVPILDLGCGRGEWLAAATAEGLAASGVDLNPINVDYCRAKQLDVVQGDALTHLATIGDNSVGAVSAFQLVEHIPFPVLLRLTDEILRVLKPGGMLIYETPNPENLLVATHSFWIDPTHVRPLPPVLLEFLVMQAGFADVEVHRLHPGDRPATSDETLSRMLGCARDYAVVARKPEHS